MIDIKKITRQDLTENSRVFTSNIDRWYDNLRSMMATEIEDFVIKFNLTEEEAIKIVHNDLIPEPHLFCLAALLEDEDFEWSNK